MNRKEYLNNLAKERGVEYAQAVELAGVMAESVARTIQLREELTAEIKDIAAAASLALVTWTKASGPDLAKHVDGMLYLEDSQDEQD